MADAKGWIVPSGVDGFRVDQAAASVKARRAVFVQWAQALAGAVESKVSFPDTETENPSFVAAHLERLDRWLLQNGHVPVVGVLSAPPVVGAAWAVGGTYLPFETPPFLRHWGPQLVPDWDLNRALGPADIANLPTQTLDRIERYKPATVGQVVFNYWL